MSLPKCALRFVLEGKGDNATGQKGVVSAKRTMGQSR
jgi:hypothetical protein